jgi:serine/threonine-protein kinase RsbW
VERTDRDSNRLDSIRLVVPATAAAVRITRVGAAGLATRAGFGYGEVEEVRLAVGEAAAMLALGDADRRSGGEAVLVVVYTVGPDGLHVEMQVEHDGDRPVEVPALAAAVLDANVDAWEASGTSSRVVLHKRRADAYDEDD